MVRKKKPRRRGPRHRDKRPELVVGLVAPIGTDLEAVTTGLGVALEAVGYTIHPIKLMDMVEAEYGDTVPDTYPERYDSKMNLGNRFRKDHGGDPEAVAWLGIEAIFDARRPRKKTEGNPAKPIRRPTAFVLNQIKTVGEIRVLRETYGANCIIISAYDSKANREARLAKRIARSHHEQQNEGHRAKAINLIARDQSEGLPVGQNVQGAFPLADLFVDASSDEKVRQQLRRFVETLFGHPFRTPSRDEFGMFQAYGAALRSADWGRQVGSAIATADGEVVALGTNEVPKAHGGQYWQEDGDEFDHRDYKKPLDSNSQMIDGILVDLLLRESAMGWLSRELAALARGPASNALFVEKRKELLDKIADLESSEDSRLAHLSRDRAQLKNVIEFFRAVHAEMAAFMSAARRGVPVSGCTMFVTTFPCHECARHIVASGIRRVVFVDPYPKSRVLDLFDDSIVVDGVGDERHLEFTAFIGIAPRRYLEWFLSPERKIEGTEKWADWEQIRGTATPRNGKDSGSYGTYEAKTILRLRPMGGNNA